ncbi:MAG: hypothetical protein JOZ17_14280 [Acetobacteraceae bacterium]|nr:hypothetical protein [Acetobacteraceae bacterium]
MTTETDGRPGVLRRLLKKVAIWEEALNYSGFDYTFDRLANVERELAALKARIGQLEASRQEPQN